MALCLQSQRQTNDDDRTENSCLLRRRLPGEIVLADRGFDIADRVGFLSSSPSYTGIYQRQKQLSAKEEEETTKIAMEESTWKE